MDHSVTTVVRQPRSRRAAIILGYPALGALVGALAVLAAEWVAQLSSSYDGLLGFADRVGEPVGLLVGTVLGLAVGLVVAVAVRHDSLRVAVAHHRITMTWQDARVSVPRTLVNEVVLADDLVLLGEHSVELARVPCDLDRAGLRRALQQHDYPRPLPTDPYAAEFRSASAATSPEPALSEEVRRLLDAHAAAVSSRSHGDGELLRRELAARGVMVRLRRVRGRYQPQWRFVAPSLPVPLPATDAPPEAATSLA